ncbi:MAG TPA: cytochrome c oxidase subunit 3 [Candidatus Acidoferrum sp.]|nr:cytochrome c oxidase subunit 3 [Candidatus Acidoferrum sp.]
MATTLPPPKSEELEQPERSRNGSTGNGGWQNLVPAEGNLRTIEDYSPPPSSSAIWVGIAAICMSFAAFTSALIVRQGASNDWRHIALPSILFASTALLLASSVTLEVARRRIAAYMGGLSRQATNSMLWLCATLGLGLLFVVGQYMAWLQLRSQGLYLATNPNSSFFYVFTAMHALHVLGGLAGLLRVIRKLALGNLRRSTLNATSYYWHFMGVLWIYLFLLLWLRI